MSSDEKKDEEKRGDDIGSLLMEHSLRLAVIVALAAMSLRGPIGYIVWQPSSSSATTTMNSLTDAASLALSVLGSVVFLNWLRIEIRLIGWRTRLPPGSLGYPLLGTLPQLLKDITSHKYILGQKKKYGDLYTDNSLSFQVVTTTEETIAWLWNTERKGGAQGTWPTGIAKLVGKGAIANANGKRHRALRRILEPAFTPTATRDYLQVIDQVTQKVLTEWSATSIKDNNSNNNGSDEGIPFHSSEVFKMYALRLFFVAAFGREGDPEVLQQLHDDFKIWIQGFISPIPYRLPGTQFAKSMDAKDRILAMVEKVVVQFKKENPPDSDRAKTTMMGRACYGVDEDGEPMSMDDLKDNVLNMIFAGHDTTFASLATAIHYICKFRPIHESLLEEVRHFKEPLDFDELKNAPVLNAFLAECWRMDPPVPFGTRKVNKPVSFKGYRLPTGINVAYNIILMSQSEEVYPMPESFEMQRFLPEGHPLIVDPEIKKAASKVDYNSMKASYPIFGGGTHACLGVHFAKLEMRVLVTRLLQSFAIEERNAKKVCFPVNGWTNEFRLTPLKT